MKVKGTVRSLDGEDLLSGIAELICFSHKNMNSTAGIYSIYISRSCFALVQGMLALWEKNLHIHCVNPLAFCPVITTVVASNSPPTPISVALLPRRQRFSAALMVEAIWPKMTRKRSSALNLLLNSGSWVVRICSHTKVLFKKNWIICSWLVTLLRVVIANFSPL